MAIVFVHEDIIYLIPLAIRTSAGVLSQRPTLLRLARSKVARRKGKGLRLRALWQQAPHARWVARHRAGLGQRRRGRGGMVGIQQRALESVAVEEESAVVDKRVYHEQDGGSEARPQERVWWVVVGGVGCVSRSVAPRQGSARGWPFPRRSPPRIVPGMSDVECLSVGRRRSRFGGRK